MMREAEELSVDVGTAPACRALGVSRATVYRHRWVRDGRALRCSPGPHPRRISDKERQEILDILHGDRFVDTSPAETYSTLLDEGQYLCSERTMYRVLDEAGEVRERRNQLTHPAYTKPELLATGPNQVWSWDITKLKGPAKWVYYYLYVILDIFSRYVVGWMVAPRETTALARRLVAQTCEKQAIQPGKLTIHADRGPSMRAKLLAQLLADLGVTKSHSRPYTSTDNPYSESQFRTMKYRPNFPDRFGSIEDAVAFGRVFFPWYNTEHRHSGIGMLTPETVHDGRAEEVIEGRRVVLERAYHAHPERFVLGVPKPSPLPTAAWINPPAHAAQSDGTGV